MLHTILVIYPASPLRRIMLYSCRRDYCIELTGYSMTILYICSNGLPWSSGVIIYILILAFYKVLSNGKKISLFLKLLYIFCIYQDILMVA